MDLAAGVSTGFKFSGVSPGRTAIRHFDKAVCLSISRFTRAARHPPPGDNIDSG